ncbi:unnamed protein product [Soboliphyme baturini]|uniref:HAP1 N-terminal domain-containing protein n=1 Tax=Soboliphyme baturini TaxID=241478 RepID=A0A183IF73_9BILA|nr:unnamed protein product [Soboliphyme baturini]
MEGSRNRASKWKIAQGDPRPQSARSATLCSSTTKTEFRRDLRLYEVVRLLLAAICMKSGDDKCHYTIVKLLIREIAHRTDASQPDEVPNGGSQKDMHNLEQLVADVDRNIQQLIRENVEIQQQNIQMDIGRLSSEIASMNDVVIALEKQLAETRSEINETEKEVTSAQKGLSVDFMTLSGDSDQLNLQVLDSELNSLEQTIGEKQSLYQRLLQSFAQLNVASSADELKGTSPLPPETPDDTVDRSSTSPLASENHCPIVIQNETTSGVWV